VLPCTAPGRQLSSWRPRCTQGCTGRHIPGRVVYPGCTGRHIPGLFPLLGPVLDLWPRTSARRGRARGRALSERIRHPGRPVSLAASQPRGYPVLAALGTSLRAKGSSRELSFPWVREVSFRAPESPETSASERSVSGLPRARKPAPERTVSGLPRARKPRFREALGSLFVSQDPEKEALGSLF